MKIRVCTPLSVESITSRRNNFGLGPHFCQQNELISVKNMKRMDYARSCQLFLEYCACLTFNNDISFTSISTFIKFTQSEKTM